MVQFMVILGLFVILLLFLYFFLNLHIMHVQNNNEPFGTKKGFCYGNNYENEYDILVICPAQFMLLSNFTMKKPSAKYFLR